MADVGESVYVDFNFPFIVSVVLVSAAVFLLLIGGRSVARNFLGGGGSELPPGA
jgi:hypothetical protein